VTIPFGGPTFNEFTIRLPKRAEDVVASLLQRGIAAGVPVGSYYPGEENSVVVTVTEKRTKGEIALLARELEGALWN
jgi:glycine dehydrogenase subunit 1